MAEFDKGINTEQINLVSTNMAKHANDGRAAVIKVLEELRSISSKWWGTRSADMMGKINSAEADINKFHEEIKEMNRILDAVEKVFVDFDAQTGP